MVLMQRFKKESAAWMVLLSCFVCLSCKDKKPKEPPKIATENRLSKNKKAMDSCIALLQDGDIVLRTGSDMTSFMLTQVNLHDKTYSHCGIVLMENKKPMVYHSIGGEENPDQTLKKEPAADWFSPAINNGIGILRYHFPDSTLQNLDSVTKTMYRQKRMFDMEFDLATDDRLYCAEFVFKALRAATKDTNFLQPFHYFGYTFVPVDNLFTPPSAQFVCRLLYK